MPSRRRGWLGKGWVRKLLWGSDMPNVGRYCTYRQALGYLWDHADFLSSEDRRRIFRENTLELLALDRPPR